MGLTNFQLIQRAISTGDFSGTGNAGLLNPYQARQFIQQTFEATNLSPLVRHEMHVERIGEIDKIGIASRIVRGKSEGVDDGYRAGIKTGSVPFATTPVRLPWEITEETLRQNIEGESLEAKITNLMTSQLAVDLEDLYLNGDDGAATAGEFSASTAYAAGDIVIYGTGLYMFVTAHAAGAWSTSDVVKIGDAGDADFLKLNDGWIKQIMDNGHVLNANVAKYSNGAMSLDVFYDAVAQIPNKYNNGRLRWLMSPRRAQQWELFLMNKVVTNGGAVPDSVYKSPVSIPAVQCPSMSDDKIILVDPQNLIVVNSYTVKIRKTTEGKEAIMQDKRFYVVHLDYDPIIEETDAVGIITGLA